MRARDGFTLLEICLAVFIAVLLMTLAIPSVSGLLTEQKARKSFEAFDDLVREAQSRSVTERRPYLIAWDDKGVSVLPERPANKEEAKGTRRIELAEGEAFGVSLPAALEKQPLREWVFWPSGTCEPANITHEGPGGAWTANYDPLTVRAEMTLQ